jgi:hypothetical protein
VLPEIATKYELDRKTRQQMEHQKLHICLDQEFICYLKYYFIYFKDVKILLNIKHHQL